MDINALQLFSVTVVHYLVGMLWFSPLLFGKAWMKEVGYTDKDMEKMKEKGMAGVMLAGFVSSLVLVFVATKFVDLLGPGNFQAGAEIGFWLWLGFVATGTLGGVLWEGKTPKWFLITAGYALVAIALVFGLLAYWPA